MENKPLEDKIIPIYIEDEMKNSYIDYAMSVIISRALPDVRDGLKPVHRRILYAMNELGLTSKKAYKKCARVVGDVLGKYHPHGDTAVYDAMVRLAQNFSCRYPLVDGHGNFGSIDGDSPAAMRYTEARMDIIAEEILQDIEKETIDFTPNFDESLQEPSVLPCRFPNLLVNGSSGIAVGMATNIPPHNLREIAEAIEHLLDNPEATTIELMQFVKGPDFPTGAAIMGTRGIVDAYETGRGKLIVRAKIEVEDLPKRKKQSLIVREIPYQANKTTLIEQLADLVKNRKLEGVSDIRDESDREGMRLCIDLKRGENPDVILNRIYKYSGLQTTFGVNMLALHDGRPRVMGLKTMLEHYIAHRRVVIDRRTRYDLRKAEERAHILEGLLKALDNIDRIIALIRGSKDASEAKEGLQSEFGLTLIQAQAILDMKLQRLTGLERIKLEDEYKELNIKITDYKDILARPERVSAIIKDETAELSNVYGDERRTIILAEGPDDLMEEDLIKNESVVVTVTHSGYAKRTSIDEYRAQRRGGRGVVSGKMKEDDLIDHLIVANTHDYLLFFSCSGQVHWKKVWQIPSAGRQAKGKAVVNLIQIEPGEKITACIPVTKFEETMCIVMATKFGTVKKSSLMDYSRPRSNGIKAIVLDEGDKLIGVQLTDGESELILATHYGQAIRFKEKDVRVMGRVTRGVRGIKLEKQDFVVGMVLVDPSKTLLVVTENGYGKRTEFSAYRITRRGGKGIRNIITSIRNGLVTSIASVHETEGVILISQNGMIIRCYVKDISKIGRNTQGVRLMRLVDGDRLVTMETVVDPEDPEMNPEASIDEDKKPDTPVEENKTDDNKDAKDSK